MFVFLSMVNEHQYFSNNCLCLLVRNLRMMSRKQTFTKNETVDFPKQKHKERQHSGVR